MAIAIQAAAEPVVPADASSKASGATDSSDSPSGFAAVVRAATSSKGEGSGKAAKGTKEAGDGVATDKDARTDADTAGNAAAAAIAAALAALRVLDPLHVTAPAAGAAPAGTTAQAITAATLPGTVVPDATKVADVSDIPTVGPASAATAGATTPPPAVNTAAIVVPPTEAGMSAAAAVAEANKIVAAKPGPIDDLHHKDPPDKTDAPPVDAGMASSVQDSNSVVRFVGNADKQDGKPGDKGGDAPAPGKAPIPSLNGTPNSAAVSQARAADPTAVSDVPKAAAPAPVVPPAVEQVAHTVIEQVEKGGGSARIHLHPEALGDVTIQVHVDGDHIRVEVHAERADAMNLLRDHTADLSNLLGNRGLNLADVYVGLGGQPAQDSQHEQQQAFNNRPNNGEFSSLMGIDEAPAIERSNRLRSAYNPDGALSYLV